MVCRMLDVVTKTSINTYIGCAVNLIALTMEEGHFQIMNSIGNFLIIIRILVDTGMKGFSFGGGTASWHPKVTPSYAPYQLFFPGIHLGSLEIPAVAISFLQRGWFLFLILKLGWLFMAVVVKVVLVGSWRWEWVAPVHVGLGSKGNICWLPPPTQSNAQVMWTSGVYSLYRRSFVWCSIVEVFSQTAQESWTKSVVKRGSPTVWYYDK
ncbi:hypothetical protein BC830DRAFT_1217148 [Chytriomyces sp. MP71]|nr:hypothetical protein BC830DRAFT_1217148 [Chytriomyces sp. MP71]